MAQAQRMRQPRVDVWGLPLLGLLVWLSTDWLTVRVLNQPHHSVTQLEANTYPKTQLSLLLDISAIQAKVDRRTNLTEVTLTVTHPTLEEMEFKLPLSDVTQIEMALAQELGLSQESVRQLIRYRFE